MPLAGAAAYVVHCRILEYLIKRQLNCKREMLPGILVLAGFNALGDCARTNSRSSARRGLRGEITCRTIAPHLSGVISPSGCETAQSCEVIFTALPKASIPHSLCALHIQRTR